MHHHLHGREWDVRVALVRGRRRQDEPVLSEHEEPSRRLRQIMAAQDPLAQVGSVAQLEEDALTHRLPLGVGAHRMLSAVHHPRRPQPLTRVEFARVAVATAADATAAAAAVAVPVAAVAAVALVDEVEGVCEALGGEREAVEGAGERLCGQPDDAAPDALDESGEPLILRPRARGLREGGVWGGEGWESGGRQLSAAVFCVRAEG